MIIFRRNRLFHVFSTLILLWCGSSEQLESAEPQWHYPEWQQPLVDWLKSLTPEDLEVNVELPTVPPNLTDAEARRYYYAAKGPFPLLRQVSTQVATPSSAFLWEGGIWREDEELIQSALMDESHGLNSGQIWIPGHPNAANILAWAYTCDEPWNPYFGNRAVALRAAIISAVDILVRPEERFYNGDASSSKVGNRVTTIGDTWGVHPGIIGFTLSFNAFTFLQAKDQVPPEAFSAWESGFRLICDRLDRGNYKTGPGDMLLSGPVAAYYGYLATEDSYYLDLYKRWEERLIFGGLLSPGGDFYDGFDRAPDGSYNGIALHRIAELYSINPSEKLKQLLSKAYQLKGLLTLPEPNGDVISPSHFNDRSPSGFATDQYEGREVLFGAEVPVSAPYLRRVFDEHIDASDVAAAIVSSIGNPTELSPGPYAWGKGKGAHERMHDWERVLYLPYVLYPNDDAALLQMVEHGPDYPLLALDRYTENFGDQYIMIRRPTYAVNLYAGPATTSDRGATNYYGTVDYKGGYFNGFSGGGISSFWTPEAGTLMIGRMSAKEGYDRMEVNGHFVPGWMDWANNHIVGETVDGKILTSARTSWPESRFSNTEGMYQLELVGEFVGSTGRQGQILHGRMHYGRRYGFHESHVSVDVAVRAGLQIDMKSMYETLPVHVVEDGEITFHDENGSLLEVVDGVRSRVRYIVINRDTAGVCVAFQKDVIVPEISEAFATKQQGPSVHVKSLQIQFPELSLAPRDTIGISYDLVPFVGGWSVEGSREIVEKEGMRSPESVFPDQKFRSNMLTNVGDYDDDNWIREKQGDGEMPIISDDGVMFDVRNGSDGSSRSKLAQRLQTEAGKKYLMWIRATSDRNIRLHGVLQNRRGAGSGSFTVSLKPGIISEAWCSYIPTNDDSLVRLQLLWANDSENEALVDILEWRVEEISASNEDLVLFPGALGPVPLGPGELKIIEVH